MADWDEDSKELRANLVRVLRQVRDSAFRRDPPSLEAARKWQTETMAGLDVPDKAFVGRFRGERGVEKIGVGVENKPGTPPGDVAQHLAVFERKLKRAIEALDARYLAGSELDADGLAAVIEVSAWAHAEWVRIHPFANGNGRTARFFANFVFMRYGLPPVIRMRPRPDEGYGPAGRAAMDGDWQPTVAVFRRILVEALNVSTVAP